MVTVLVAILLVFAFAFGTAVAALELAGARAGRAAQARRAGPRPAFAATRRAPHRLRVHGLPAAS